MIFFGAKEFFYAKEYLISKMAVKMNLRMLTKNQIDQEIRFLAKSILKSNGCATAMPTAWELI